MTALPPASDGTHCAGCGGDGPERIFAVHRDSPARFAYTVSGSNASIVVHVRTDCDDEASELGCCACSSNQNILDAGTFQLSWEITPCGNATDTDGDCYGS